MKKILIPIATLALMTGCSDRGADKDGDGKITSEEMAAEMNEVQIEPGQWENTVEFVDVSIDNLPAGTPEGMMQGMIETMKGRKVTSKNCITPEQAEKPGAEFFAAQDKANCEIKEFSMAGGDIKSDMMCKGEAGMGDMQMVMTGQYGPSSYDMEMTMNGGAQGVKMNIKAKNSGKRIGDCPS